jgi:hypothetical protein
MLVPTKVFKHDNFELESTEKSICAEGYLDFLKSQHFFDTDMSNELREDKKFVENS